jgi:hypothetical protein
LNKLYRSYVCSVEIINLFINQLKLKLMSDSKVFMFPDNVAGAGGGANALDPNLLLALNNGGGFGGNGNWMWILFLFFLWPFMRNGNWGGFGGGNGFGADGTGYLANLANNDTGRELLMQAINGNGDAIRQLSSMLGCKIDSIQSAICNLGTQIQQVGSQVGMGFQQTINAVQAGNTQLGMQIAQCCCDMRAQLATSTCDIKESVNTVNSSVARGFADVGYALRDQTCNIEKAIASSTAQILAGQAAIEKRELQREIDTLREQKETFKIGNLINGAIAPLAAEVAGIKCKLPTTETVNVSPEYVPIQRGINIGYAPYCANGFGAAFGGWNGGNCGNFQWG